MSQAKVKVRIENSSEIKVLCERLRRQIIAIKVAAVRMNAVR